MLSRIPARPRRRALGLWIAPTLLLVGTSAFAQAISDPDFNVSVRTPTYTREHPKVVIDQGHHNYHTADGRYKPLADLLRNDGYEVTGGTGGQFDSESLQGARVLIVANALGSEFDRDASKPAFTPQECDTVREWVRAGGALLLIADHAPFGSAAYDLAARFDVDMGKGFLFDPKNSEKNPTILVFSRTNGLLGDHPVTDGRNDSERVQRIVAFTGQSLSVPHGATALMRLAPSAYETSTFDEGMKKIKNAGPDANSNDQARSITARAQGVALEFGKGRVIIVGEAAMFSAQLAKSNKPGKPDFRFGMNAPGNDDRQFALNALHWLSGAYQ
jgi:hypothetical protein